METVHGMSGDNLDLILHSPGGSAEAVEGIVVHLRSKFSDFRVIIPQAAMSAATMLSCAANKIIMGRQSYLGPIDPQIVISTQKGYRMMPAQTILDEFELAQKTSVENPNALAAYLPILNQYHPGLIPECKQARRLAENLVADWLKLYMFAKHQDAEKKATMIAKALSDHNTFASHSRHIHRDTARATFELEIDYLEKDQTLQDLVLSVFHATTITLQNTPTQKIIENHMGKAYVKSAKPRNVLVDEHPQE